MISTASDGSGALAESGSHPGKFLASSPSQMGFRARADGLPADVIRQIIEYSDNDSLRNLLLVSNPYNIFIIYSIWQIPPPKIASRIRKLLEASRKSLNVQATVNWE